MSKLKAPKKDWTSVETHMAELKSIFADTAKMIKRPKVKRTIIKNDKAYLIKLIP